MHDHSHHTDNMNPEEQKALLEYLHKHNQSHESELHELAHTLEAPAAELIHEAIAFYRKGNELLEKACAALEEK